MTKPVTELKTKVNAWEAGIYF